LDRVIVESMPDVERPIFAVGFSGVGNVGLIALDLLLKFSDGKKLGNYYSKNLPDHIVIEDDGVCHLPRLEFFASKSVDPNIVMVMSSTPMLSEDPKSRYDVLDDIVRFALELHSSMLIAVDGVATMSDKVDVIHVSATNPKLVMDLQKLGAHPYEAGRLPGSVGLLVGLSEYRGLKGIGVLGSAASFLPDSEAGKRVYDFLVKALHFTKVDAPA
jgi:proteasome assembly chaperone (PAC2) family protein